MPTMPMPPYRVPCSREGCGLSAAFKIASCWSDGVTRELKTYALSCEACLGTQLRGARAKQSACRLAPGESLEPPGVFEMARGVRDVGLCRRCDLETKLVPDPTV